MARRGLRGGVCVGGSAWESRPRGKPVGQGRVLLVIPEPPDRRESNFLYALSPLHPITSGTLSSKIDLVANSIKIL